MTEPLLIGLTLMAVALLIWWCGDQGTFAARFHSTPQRDALTGITFALACMTRYEAWPVTVCALAAAVWVRWRADDDLRTAIIRVSKVAVYPAGAVLAFLVFSRVVIGEWFVASGFFVPENLAQGHPYLALAEVVWGLRELSGVGLIAVAAVGAVALVVRAASRPARGLFVLPLALCAAAALPWLAFVDGHPYRIRYMVPLVAAEAVCAGTLSGLWKGWCRVAAVGLLLLAGYELAPLDGSPPMVAEAQWDRPNRAVRREVTDCLAAEYGGETVMASMGSLGHYMQELSGRGFPLREFLHEGNGDVWLMALIEPRLFAGWMLIEEKAEGGDMLARRSREDPRFLDGFSRVCEGAGVVLYRRGPAPAN